MSRKHRNAEAEPSTEPQTAEQTNGTQPTVPDGKPEQSAATPPKAKKPKPPRDISLCYAVATVGRDGKPTRVHTYRHTVGQARKLVPDICNITGVAIADLGVYRMKRVV